MSGESRVIEIVERAMRDALDRSERSNPAAFGAANLPLYGVLRYHLGWADTAFRPAGFDPGKRTRPLICMLVCDALGGNLECAAPVAAAIELLHNFSLIHDDIQDESETRRHRSTVWHEWGTGQAINAGDAMFAVSQLTLLDAGARGLPSDKLIEIVQAFNETTLRIVEGQVLDLSFEPRWDLSTSDYLTMIEGKTSAILAFAAWAGAEIAGATDEGADLLRRFGRDLGLGFQVRDDLLGIWGTSATGKPVGDDIRRRKKSLPIITLALRASPADLQELHAIYAQPTVDEGGVERVLALLETYRVEPQIQEVVDRYHREARDLLLQAIPAVSGARQALEALLDRLATRTE